MLTDLRTTSPGTVRGVLRTLLAYDLTAEVGQYQGPARLVVTPLNTGPGSLIQLRPDWPAEVVEETGHWLHLDRPDQFQKVLDEFLASLT